MGVLKLIVIGAFALVLLTILFSEWRRAPVSLPVRGGTAAAVYSGNAFAATGALSHHLRGGEETAWLVYMSGKNVATKNLVIPAAASCSSARGTTSCPRNPRDLVALYSGRHVRVVGREVKEHVVVEEIRHAETDDARLALVVADFSHSATAHGVTIIPRAYVDTDGIVAVYAEMVEGGSVELLPFEMGGLVRVGDTVVSLVHLAGGVLYFAIALETTG